MTGSWTALFVCLCAGPIVLENGAVRIEVDPQLFSVQFAGFPGGPNFVDPLRVEDAARTGMEWVDPGGMVTDVFPAAEHDAALRRGPASVEFQDGRSAVLLGPASEKLGIRLKKEIRLAGDEPKARYIVTLLAPSQDEQRWALRNTARVPLRSTIRIDKDKNEIVPMAGLDKLTPAVVRSMQYWLIPIPPTSPMSNVVLGSPVRSFAIENRSGVWTRTMVAPTREESAADAPTPFFCVLDDATRSYGAALQSARQAVTLGDPLVFIEDWQFERRGVPAEKPEKTGKESEDAEKK